MKKLSPKLIIFDWDDVITLGAKEGYFACYDKALEAVDVTLPADLKQERILSKWGKNHIEEIKELLKEKPELVDKAVKAYENAFFGDVFTDSLHIIHGAVDILKRLAKKHKLSVATGGHPKILRERIMPKFQIPNLFEMIVSAYDINDQSKTKPDPYMLDLICQKVGTKKDETIYVGDAENDVIMARNAGITPIVVLSGYLSEERAKFLQVDLIIKDITYMREVVEI